MVTVQVENNMAEITIKTLEIAGFASAVSALRLPFKKECRSDVSSFQMIDDTCVFDDSLYIKYGSSININEKDMHLMSVLVKRGDEHAKVLRGLIVYAEINAPIWFYREMETYRIGRERLSCESTMHCECRGMGGEELEAAKDSIPMGHMQKTVDMFSYQTLRRIYIQRRNHRLPMWQKFCAWIESLPCANQLILIGLKDETTED